MEGSWRVPLGEIAVDDEIVDEAVATIRSGWWSMGPRVQEFERAFADACGVAHALAVSSGTAALHLALLAVGCRPDDEVVLPSLNFVAAANCVREIGATPVFCDIAGEGDLNLDPVNLAAALTPRTKAIVALHYAGYPCEMQAVLEVARGRGVAVVEDAAHAPGATWHGRACGTLGDVGCFSLFANKNLPAGEGGVVVTADERVAEQVRLLRSHGMTTLTWDRHQGHASTYDVLEPGFNYRLDEIRATLARVGLRRLPEANRRRGAVIDEYRRRLPAPIALAFPRVPDHVTPAYHLAVAVLPEAADRDRFRRLLAERGIQTSVHYPPIHQLRLYRSVARRELPRTDAIAPRLITLPLFPHMTDKQVDEVVAAVAEGLAEVRAVRV